MSEAIFQKVLEMSLTASWIALAVILVRLVFPKAPKWSLCLLWGLVALRLMCPFAPESEISLAPRPERVEQIIVTVTGTTAGELDPEQIPQVTPSPGNKPNENPGHSAPALPQSRIWAFGVLGMLSYALGSILLLKRRMGEATLLRDNLWQSERAESPFVLGFLRPRIYLPYHIRPEDLPHVIAHEQAHIRRLDHWWKPLGFLLLAVHWFNPVLWVSYILLCRDIEGACDEKVISSMEKQEKQAYSTALLHCSVRRSVIAACPLAFGEVGVKERVKHVMKFKKPSILMLAIAILICVAVGGCFLTDPVDSPEETEPPVETRMINLNGILYIDSGEILSEIPENTTTGTLHTQVEGRPQNHNQGNFDCVGCDWVLVIPDGGPIEYAVRINEQWHLFTPEVREFPEYWLTVGDTDVWQITVYSGSTSATFFREDFTPYAKGEQVRLDTLTGTEYLFGTAITAKNAKGQEIWSIAVSGQEYGTGAQEIVSGDWIITPVHNAQEREALKARYAQSNVETSVNWGIEPLVKNVTPAGLDLFLFRYGKPEDPVVMASENYLLYQLKNGLWEQIAVVPADWSDGERLRELRVADDDEIGDAVRLKLNWEALCGPLPSGTYRISTDVAQLDGAGRMVQDKRLTMEFMILSNEEEARIYETVQQLLTAHIHNLYLYTDEGFDHLTVLSLGEDDPACQEYGGNIRFLKEKERYYKHVRQGENITREDFNLSFALHSITCEEGTAKVRLSCGISFRYTDQEVESGEVPDYYVELVNRDGMWLVSYLLDIYDWFDGAYQNDPNFDVDALIAEYDRIRG